MLSLILYGHLPFVRHPEKQLPYQELWLFQSISETYIPLLEVFDHLDRDLIPFRVSISLSPALMHMLSDELLIQRYLDYTDKQIEFGAQELESSSEDKQLHSLIMNFYNRIVGKRLFFTERLEKNILKGFDYYQKKGRLEILATAATHAFLPFYTSYPEAMQAQFELAISTYKTEFGKVPGGFWPPELGWNEDLDTWLRNYNFTYTIVDAHALAFARPPAEKGCFYPVKTPQGIIVLGRDFYASEDILMMSLDPAFRHRQRDQGFELPHDRLGPFLGTEGSRSETGYKYWATGEDGSGKEIYNHALAMEKVKSQAQTFIENRLSKLEEASSLIEGPPLSLCAFDADSLGRFWYEGPEFIEALFREAAKGANLQFMTPTEYLCKLDSTAFQTAAPEFSSLGENGYAEMWLDASNDWLYRHTMRAIERMAEIAERFPDDTGLKERALNQAARELMLVLASDWSKMLYKQEDHDYARNRIESSLRNFTTIYEALGSSYINTEWLTHLEKRNNIFPSINYRIFRRKQ